MWKYNGRGFIIGIPARDLSDEEAKRYMPRVKKCGLYVHVKDRQPKEKYTYQTPVNDQDDDKGETWQELKHYAKSR